MVNEVSYYFCLIKYPGSSDIFPYIKIGNDYPLNYLEWLSYLENSKIEHLNFMLEQIRIDVFEKGLYFQIEQSQTRFIEVRAEHSVVYELFTDNVLFIIETNILLNLLYEWRNFLVDFDNKKWLFVPTEYVKPEYWDLLKQQQQENKE